MAPQEPQVLHQDEDLLVVNKPAGLLAVPGKGEAGQHHLLGWVQAQCAGALLVHRLDMATSGLMLFARHKTAQQRLGLAFEQRRVAKTYTALVWGTLPAPSGQINQPLAADWLNRPRQIVSVDGGRPALTHWQVLGGGDGGGECDSAVPASQTRLKLNPVSGRSHQLRVHLQWLGHPIVGDRLYGPDPHPPQRLMLHATRLGLQHPVTDEPCSFFCAAPF
jgi:tRNA pseudouridine32 synthase / 23S rRNA pseudouridine746 synthase